MGDILTQIKVVKNLLYKLSRKKTALSVLRGFQSHPGSSPIIFVRHKLRRQNFVLPTFKVALIQGEGEVQS